MTSIFRECVDKKGNNPDDVRFDQITKLVEITDGDLSTQEEQDPSTLLERKVFAKESKGTTMVRKFVLWKTNKEQSGNYPAYVFHYTDFSPSRKDMLKVDLKASSSKEQIHLIFNESLEKNVKKGWVEQ